MVKETEEGNYPDVGSTNNIKRRRGEHERCEGYVGTMFYLEVDNMELAENKLFKACLICRKRKGKRNCCRYNKHMKSNNSNKKGYVYGIKGKQRKKNKEENDEEEEEENERRRRK